MDTRDRIRAFPSWSLVALLEKTHVRRESPKEPWRAKEFHTRPYFLRPGRMDKTLQRWKPSALRPSELVFLPLCTLPLGFGDALALEERDEPLKSTTQPILLFLPWGNGGGGSGKLSHLLSHGLWFSKWRSQDLNS